MRREADGGPSLGRRWAEDEVVYEIDATWQDGQQERERPPSREGGVVTFGNRPTNAEAAGGDWRIRPEDRRGREGREMILKLVTLEHYCAQLRAAGHGDDSTIWATVDEDTAPGLGGMRPVHTLGGFSTPQKAAESQARYAEAHGGG